MDEPFRSLTRRVSWMIKAQFQKETRTVSKEEIGNVHVCVWAGETNNDEF